ncbi:MAG: hypothetical protein AB7O44_30320 [Hyphomicrobiaceae bacterium]
MTEPFPLRFAPGIVKSDSPYSLRGRYVDADKVRFVKGQPEKHKGHVRFSDETLTGIPRAALAWDDFSANRRIAVGTHLKLALAGTDGTITNITPFRSTGTLGSDPFAVTDTSTTVVVTHTGHGNVVGSTVIFEGATAGGGIAIDGEYEVTSVIDANSYEIQHSAPATSTDATTGGSSVDFSYEILPGFANVSQGRGFGVGLYGAGTYGTPRSGSSFTQYPRTWSLDLYGQNLLGMASGLFIYEWQPGVSTRAAKVANSPSGQFMFVTNERFPVVLGAGGQLMTIAWPDQNDITDWTPGEGKTAVSRRLQGGSRLICGAALRPLQNVIWSDTSVFAMQYTGAILQVYSTPRIGDNCGIVGPHAFAIAGGIAYWRGSSNFFMYSGAVAPIPNADDINDWLTARLNGKQNWKCQAHYSPRYNEITWFYVHADHNESAYYVAVCLNDFSWTVGTSDRVLLREAAGINAAVYGFSPGGVIYQHEIGVDADGEAMPWFLESSPLDIDNGSIIADVQGYIPDFQRQAGPVELTLTGFDAPNEDTPIDTVNKQIAEKQGIVDMSFGARQASIHLAGITIGSDFRLGLPKLEVQGSGTRRP